MATWDKVTDARIQTLHPSIRHDAEAFINAALSQYGIKLRIAQAYRTSEEQQKLFEQPKHGLPFVTGLPGGQSIHNYALAFDVVAIDDAGKADWDITWEPIGTLGETYGFTWGGRFVHPQPDRPHFQKAFGMTWKQLKALPRDANGFVIISKK